MTEENKVCDLNVSILINILVHLWPTFEGMVSFIEKIINLYKLWPLYVWLGFFKWEYDQRERERERVDKGCSVREERIAVKRGDGDDGDGGCKSWWR